jgi:glycosyltransferase involved in cell wall biosynthesis
MYKGCILLLKSAYLLQEQGITNFTVNIYGANLENQPEDFQEEFKQFHAKVKDRVLLRGSYKQQELQTLMLEVDWVVMPSIWWENSPVVIQEAFFHGRPVITSDIGGMAEKVEGHGGLTFSVRNPSGLAALMERCIGNVALHQGLRESMSQPCTAAVCAEQHLHLYRKLRSISRVAMAEASGGSAA